MTTPTTTKPTTPLEKAHWAFGPPTATTSPTTKTKTVAETTIQKVGQMSTAKPLPLTTTHLKR